MRRLTPLALLALLNACASLPLPPAGRASPEPPVPLLEEGYFALKDLTRRPEAATARLWWTERPPEARVISLDLSRRLPDNRLEALLGSGSRRLVLRAQGEDLGAFTWVVEYSRGGADEVYIREAGPEGRRWSSLDRQTFVQAEAGPRVIPLELFELSPLEAGEGPSWQVRAVRREPSLWEDPFWGRAAALFAPAPAANLSEQAWKALTAPTQAFQLGDGVRPVLADYDAVTGRYRIWSTLRPSLRGPMRSALAQIAAWHWLLGEVEAYRRSWGPDSRPAGDEARPRPDLPVEAQPEAGPAEG